MRQHKDIQGFDKAKESKGISKHFLNAILVIIPVIIIAFGLNKAFGISDYIKENGFPERINYNITDSSQAITISEEAEFVNPDNKEDSYQIITINNRDYIIYGTQNRTVTGKMIGNCIAYDSRDNNQRFYSLKDCNQDYIASFYVNGEMEQFQFLRAVDTIGKESICPNYINSLNYEIWSTSQTEKRSN